MADPDVLIIRKLPDGGFVIVSQENRNPRPGFDTNVHELAVSQLDEVYDFIDSLWDDTPPPAANGPSLGSLITDINPVSMPFYTDLDPKAACEGKIGDSCDWIR